MRMHLAALAAATTLLAACGGGGAIPATGSSGAGGLTGPIKGDITVLTNRTDIVDTVFQDYKKRFEAKYPGTNVHFEAIAEYETDVSTRLNSGDYGDVLEIPRSVPRNQLPVLFAPLGTVAELSHTYRFLDEQSYKGNAYGIAYVGNAQGIVYNKKVWKRAGVTKLPTSPQEFLADLKAIKDKTGAIPLYTNYSNGWPLSQWEYNRGMMGSPNATVDLLKDRSPWDEGKYHNIVDGLLYDAVANHLTEADPTTTDWESSKGLIGSGKVGAMALGSWAIVQMQQAAVKAGGAASDIGYMPYPYQVNGTFYSTISGDYQNAVSAKSQNKATAWAWVKWFADESGYAFDQGGISPRVDGRSPTTLTDLDAAGVKYLELAPPPAAEATLEARVMSKSQIDLFASIYRSKLVDIARGAAKGDKQSYFAELNKRWGAALDAVRS